jgi:tetratricopeptide (TPR) repeat protein
MRGRTGLILIVLAVRTGLVLPAQRGAIAIDYPADRSVFPPEIAAPTFLWRDSSRGAVRWRIETAISGSASTLSIEVPGEELRTGEIDPRAVAPTNELPRLTPEQAATRTWTPPAETWAAIKRNSAERWIAISITGLRENGRAVSRGQVTILTSKDAAGAPVFYRDVPLMPSELEKGVIKPLAPSAIPLIAWRLRDIGQPQSRLLLEGLHTCANCHSFSADGKTLGMDLDGPQNDKGMYAMVPVRRNTTIRNEDVITWSSFLGRLSGGVRTGFMSQVSPDGRYVVTTVDGSKLGRGSPAPQGSYYVANFKDYRFLQVFYPTRGILAWYSKANGRLEPLPGADDPRYVQTDGVWSPDGEYLVFARAEARDPYPEGVKIAERANDPSETPIQYDLYRVPFRGGQGGRPERIEGASRNGMSNSFPKISPDGRWIVFVQARNGQLMRPDSQLYIVPAEGGKARRLRANLPLMNSWHSFSPNGRWLVFSSKGRSPYTQMYLTHIDEHGEDSPAILIENATAANRAVNIPEFVNTVSDGIAKLDVPAVDFYTVLDRAWSFAQKGQNDEAIAEWNKALELSPGDAKAHNDVGVLLSRTGRFDEAIAHFEKALAGGASPADVENNYGLALAGKGQRDEAILRYRKAVNANPASAEAQNNLGRALAEKGRLDEAIGHLNSALAAKPAHAEAHDSLAVVLLWKGRLAEALEHLEKALQIDPGFPDAHYNLGQILCYVQGKIPEGVAHWRKALATDPGHLPSLTQLARVLATSPEASVRNGVEAVELARRAVDKSGGRDPAVLDTLAAAYAESGRFEEAAETVRRASALAAQQGNRRLVEALEAHMRLYRARAPLRDNRQPVRR